MSDFEGLTDRELIAKLYAREEATSLICGALLLFAVRHGIFTPEHAEGLRQAMEDAFVDLGPSVLTDEIKREAIRLLNIQFQAAGLSSGQPKRL